MYDIEIRRVTGNEREPTEEIFTAPHSAIDDTDAASKAQAEADRLVEDVNLYVYTGDDVVFVEHFQPSLIARAIKELPEKVTLGYVDYQDKLSDEQVTMLLDDDMEKLYDSIWEWEADARERGVEYELERVLDSDEEREALRDSDDYEKFREECWDRDESNMLGDLIRQTPGVMIRYSLDHDVEPYPHLQTDEELDEAARDICEAAGISYDSNRDTARLLCIEASYGGRLCVLHMTDLEDLIRVRAGGTVVFKDPNLLVYDGLNGSGSCEDVIGTVTVKIDDDTLSHDTGRYSWSDGIAGVVHSCFDTPAEFKVPETEETAA